MERQVLCTGHSIRPAWFTKPDMLTRNGHQPRFLRQVVEALKLLVRQTIQSSSQEKFVTKITRSLLFAVTLFIVGSAFAPASADAQYHRHHRHHHHYHHHR